MIDDRPLRFRGEVYHPYHFNCSSCGIELNADAREVKSRPGYTANEMVTNFSKICLRFHFEILDELRMIERVVLFEMSR